MYSHWVTSLQHIFCPSNRHDWEADVSLCHTCTHSSRCLFWHKGFLLANRNALMRIYEGVTIRANIWNTHEQACTVCGVHTTFVSANTRLPFCSPNVTNDSIEAPRRCVVHQTRSQRHQHSPGGINFTFDFVSGFQLCHKHRPCTVPQWRSRCYSTAASAAHLRFKKKSKIAHWFESRRGCFALIGGMVDLIKRLSHLPWPSPGRPLLHQAMDSIDLSCCSSMSSQKCQFQYNGDSHTPAVICAKRSWIRQILSQYGIWCGSTNRHKHLVWDELLAGRYSL